MDRGAAREAQHHEQFLLRPYSELASRLADVAGVGRADLPDYPGSCRVGDVDDEHAGMRMSCGGVRAVADVDVVTVDRQGGVHAPRVERVVPEEGEVPGRSRPDRSRYVRIGGEVAPSRLGRRLGRRRQHRRRQRTDEQGW
jgi:hypothetical protein